MNLKIKYVTCDVSAIIDSTNYMTFLKKFDAPV